jgi:hypothetical protein
MRCNQAIRSAIDVEAHDGPAATAARVASFTSSAFERGRVVSTSPVAGLMVSMVAPLVDGTNAPLMKFNTGSIIPPLD